MFNLLKDRISWRNEWRWACNGEQHRAATLTNWAS